MIKENHNKKYSQTGCRFIVKRKVDIDIYIHIYIHNIGTYVFLNKFNINIKRVCNSFFTNKNGKSLYSTILHKYSVEL